MDAGTLEPLCAVLRSPPRGMRMAGCSPFRSFSTVLAVVIAVSELDDLASVQRYSAIVR
jgi:hypothetical protein